MDDKVLVPTRSHQGDFTHKKNEFFEKKISTKKTTDSTVVRWCLLNIFSSYNYCLSL